MQTANWLVLTCVESIRLDNYLNVKLGGPTITNVRLVNSNVESITLDSDPNVTLCGPTVIDVRS